MIFIRRFFVYISYILPIILWLGVPLYAEIITEIKIIGNERVKKEYLETLMQSQVGKDFKQETLNEDLQIIYDTDLFNNIDASFNKGVITLTLQENPLIENITLSGNDALGEDVLKAEMTLKERNTYSENKVNLDLQRILELYYKSGFLASTVNYTLNKKPHNRIDVTFNIVEGKKTTIGTIDFYGNKAFSKSELEGAMLTKEHKWWRFFGAGDVYDKSRILYDGELLRQFYLENGYPNFSVVSNFTELDVNNSLVVTYVLEEGERYKFGENMVLIKVPELTAYKKQLEDMITLTPDMWFKKSLLDKEINRLRSYINTLGFQFIDIKPNMVFNDITKQVDIVFEVIEEKRIFIDKINYNGNTRTRDDVLRREMKFSENDAYSESKISLAQRNLSRTGYFSNVNITDKPSEELGKVDLDVDVEEISTGSISLGGGYSTVDKFQIEAGFTETNVFGTGNYFSINTMLSQDTNTYSVTLSDPYFLSKELFASISLYRNDTGADDYYDYSLYDQQEQGVSTMIGYNLNDNWTQKWGYRLFYRDIYNVSEDASQAIQQIEGTSFVSAVSHTITYDTRDNAVFTRKGWETSLFTEYAGVLGDTNYIKNTFKTIWYKEVAEDVVLSVLGSVGAIEGLYGQDVNIVDKYILGGSTLRGFSMGVNYGGIGPVDNSTGETLGGKYMYRGSIQIETPVPGVKQYGLIIYAFSDFGTVTDFGHSGGSYDPCGSNPAPGENCVIDTHSLRVSVGAGISWRSPAGIISLDLGFPVKKEPTDYTERLLLNFGTRF
ncbi:Outer membrane protein assembly factor BamA [Candidatus Hepatincola sp. Pdp]